jgi:MFS superfamily sulfate permease-like transporter
MLTCPSYFQFAIAASAALLLVRLAKPRGSFLGRVRVRQEDKSGDITVRDVYVPLRPVTPKDTAVVVEAPPEGIIVFRMEEAFRESFLILPNATPTLTSPPPNSLRQRFAFRRSDPRPR